MTEINRFERATQIAQTAGSTGGATLTKDEAARILAGASNPTSEQEATTALRGAGFTDIDGAKAMVETVNREDAAVLARHGHKVGEGGHTSLQDAIRAQQRETTRSEHHSTAVTGIMDERTRNRLTATEGQYQNMVKELRFSDVATFVRDYNEGKPADQQLPADGSLGPATRDVIFREHELVQAKKTVRLGQANLQGLGYDIGAAGVDGDNGEKTTAALQQFQRDNGITPVTGLFDEDTRDALAAQVRGAQEQLQNQGHSVGPHGLDGKYGQDTKAAVVAFQTAWNQANPDNPLPTDGRLTGETRTTLASQTARVETPATPNTDVDPTSTDPTERQNADLAAIQNPLTPLEKISTRLERHEPGFFAKLWDFVKELFTLTLIDTKTWNDKLTDDEIDELKQRGQALSEVDGLIAYYQIPGPTAGNLDERQLRADISAALKRSNPRLEPEELERRTEVMFNSTRSAVQTRIQALRSTPTGTTTDNRTSPDLPT